MLTVAAKEIAGERASHSSPVPAPDKSRDEAIPLLLNRELSLLQFHLRVVEEALDRSNRCWSD